jgi:excisionase family DNA binding protein
MSYYLTVKELAKLLRVGENAARAALKSGKIPSVKIGRHYLISVDDIKKMLPNFDLESFQTILEAQKAKAADEKKGK